MTTLLMRLGAALLLTLALAAMWTMLKLQLRDLYPGGPWLTLRRWMAEVLPEVLRRVHRAIGAPDFRDVVILVGLGLVWYGLRGVYPPAAPIAVGAFLIWFTAIRRVES
jgi:hypothetical protein